MKSTVLFFNLSFEIEIQEEPMFDPPRDETLGTEGNPGRDCLDIYNHG